MIMMTIKHSSLAMMESGDDSNEEAPPCDPQKEASNAKRADKGDFHACCHGN